MEQLTHEQTHWQQAKHPLILACDNWQDPRNVGMAFRLADAFGVQSIWLGDGTPCPPNRKISKTARSTDKWVPFEHKPNLLEALQQAKADGYAIWGIEISSESISLEQAVKQELPQAMVLVLGAESQGIQAAILDHLDQCCHINMHGKNTSLNVATALAIALYELSKNMIKSDS